LHFTSLICHNEHMLEDSAHQKVLADFFRKGTRLTYQKGEFIIRPGETPPGVFFIEKGLVKSYDITKYGEENLLVIRKEGELLGMTWALTNKPKQVMYAALSPTITWMITIERLDTLLKETPEAALPLLYLVTDMYRVHSERILNLEYRTVRERLISFLLSMARRFGTETSEGLLIDVPLRHQDIASSISATRETTGREITALEKKGLLSNSSSHIVLRDIPALQQFLA
jgi:CRP/FNR family cyclic AMP-dependent transcriptional regulator